VNNEALLYGTSYKRRVCSSRKWRVDLLNLAAVTFKTLPLVELFINLLVARRRGFIPDKVAFIILFAALGPGGRGLKAGTVPFFLNVTVA